MTYPNINFMVELSNVYKIQLTVQITIMDLVSLAAHITEYFNDVCAYKTKLISYMKYDRALIVTTPTQPNITKVGFDTKMTLHHPETQCQQYLSCSRPDF